MATEMGSMGHFHDDEDSTVNWKKLYLRMVFDSLLALMGSHPRILFFSYMGSSRKHYQIPS
jgi:hypothetical protein